MRASKSDDTTTVGAAEGVLSPVDHGAAFGAIDPRLIFALAVPDHEPERATPLAGFAPSLLRSAFLLRALTLLPAHVLEPLPEHHDGLPHRRASGLDAPVWRAASPRALRANPLPREMPFVFVLLGPGQDADGYRAWATSCPVPPCLVAERGGDIAWGDLHLLGIRPWLLGACDRLIASAPASAAVEAVEAREAITRWRTRTLRPAPFMVGGHNSTAPNVRALQIFGYDPPVDGPFRRIAQGIGPYIDEIARTTRLVLRERTRLALTTLDVFAPRRPPLTLFAPAILSVFKDLRLAGSAPREERVRFDAARRLLEQQRGYAFEVRSDAAATALFGKPFAAMRKPDAKPEPHPLMTMRAGELSVATEVVAALAAGEASAVLRLPNEVNRTIGTVRQFAQHFRAEARKGAKTAKAFATVAERVTAAVPAELRTIIKETDGEIRIVADAHLEWLEIDGLPLCLRRHLSRVPVTPGNLFVEQLSPVPPIRLTPHSLRRVLVISALKREDPIRRIFEVAFEAFSPEWRDSFDLSVVEVGSRDELLDALRRFGGALAIFDGHGSHDEDGAAVLHLRDARCDIWSLQRQLDSPPPLVVLSACDTHAAARNHATSANGFLALGSRSVLGSVLPLHALDAATFVARLLLRLASFVPAAVRAFGRPLTWTEVVGGMVRMQAMTDWLRALVAAGALPPAKYQEVAVWGNMELNTHATDPFRAMRERLAAEGIAEARAHSVLREAVARSSAIAYLNMGRPETVILDTDEAAAARARKIVEIRHTGPLPPAGAAPAAT